MDQPRPRLPEKVYFSLEEIAERWGCSTEELRHFISEKWLREAIESVEVWSGLEFVDINRAQGLFRKAVRSPLRSVLSEEGREILKQCILDPIPRFVYIDASEGASKFSCVYDYDGTKYLMVSGIKKYHESEIKSHSIKLTDCDGTVVPREERDRFERQYGVFGPAEPAAHLPRYCTPYLEVMHLAIAEFFEPRRDRDAKRQEVVSWIQERLTELGIGESAHIARAMFTIIKPTDHSPRKRRG